MPKSNGEIFSYHDIARVKYQWGPAIREVSKGQAWATPGASENNSSDWALNIMFRSKEAMNSFDPASCGRNDLASALSSVPVRKVVIDIFQLTPV